MDGEGFEPSKASLTDLQSAPFGHSGTHPYISILYYDSEFDKSNFMPQADDRTRTDNLLITSQLLCQLSHIGVFSFGNGTYRARTYDPLLVRQMLSQLS